MGPFQFYSARSLCLLTATRQWLHPGVVSKNLCLPSPLSPAPHNLPEATSAPVSRELLGGGAQAAEVSTHPPAAPRL